MKVWIEKPRSAPCGFLIVAEDGRDILVELDWDQPSIASNLGYVPCKKCLDDMENHDGTVDCAHKTAGEMISGAYDFLMDHLEEPFDDPGYFTE